MSILGGGGVKNFRLEKGGGEGGGKKNPSFPLPVYETLMW